MSLYDSTAAAFGRVIWRVALAFVVAAFGTVAIYYFTSAGMLALEARFSVLHAQLIVAAIYTMLAAISYAILWAMSRKRATASAHLLSAPREAQLTMLLEAALLGFSLARKVTRSR